MFEDVEESEFWPVCIYVCVCARARACVCRDIREKYETKILFFFSFSLARKAKVFLAFLLLPRTESRMMFELKYRLSEVIQYHETVWTVYSRNNLFGNRRGSIELKFTR